MNIYGFTPLKTSRKRGAFTLVEILIVIGIIALLMGITTQMLGTVSASQGRARSKTDMALIVSGLEGFASKYGGYPRVSANIDEKKSAADLYRCLTGKMIMRLNDGQIVMADVGTVRKPFIEVTKLRIADPADPLLQDVDPEKNGVYFSDSWNEPYLYFFDTTMYVTNEANTSWRSPSFILLTKGPDQKAADVKGMYTTGIIPDDEEYRLPEVNIDNILYGRDD
jgi:prepilin-type cleavage/methylation N-terminal domain protein